METLFYSAQGQQYSEAQDVAVPLNCNGMTIINRGDGMAFVNGIPLSANPTPGNAGESIAIGGNVGEIYAGRCNISFAPGQAAPLLVIVFKYYVNPKYA